MLLSLVLGFLLGTNHQLLSLKGKSPLSGEAKLSQFFHYLDRYYVDQIDTDSLASQVIERLVSDLDPHSFYISPDQYSRLAEDLQGSFMGIGVSFFMINDTVHVVRVLEGGPSKKAGILPGDRILQVDQDTLYGKQLSNSQIIGRLKGAQSTPITLELYRPGEKKKQSITLTLGQVPLASVWAYSLAAKTGYIKINRFGEHTSKEFTKALDKLKDQGMHRLILDLRDNPGGYLDAAIEIADAFLPQGVPIVSVESNQGKRTTTYATQNTSFETGEVYVLINRESASASEVVAGALQDNDRAWLMGQRSFGKGLVQQQMPLGTNEAVRLTTARYYTPTGRSIQRPFLEDRSAYFEEINQRFVTGELAQAQQVPKQDSLAYTTPKGRTVYGGGGIIPDLYIPLKNSLEEEWQHYILQSNLINHFVYLTLDKNRSKLTQPSQTDFLNSPLAEDQFWLLELEKYLEQEKVPLTDFEAEEALQNIRAYLALQWYGEIAQRRVINESDPLIQAAQTHNAKETKGIN